MRALCIVCFAGILASGSACAQSGESSRPVAAYDSVLAKQLGADEFGMKHYVMAFLRAGPKRILDSVKREELRRSHLQNILRLTKEGKLLVAGPFLDDQELRGIFIFNVENIDEARAIAETDPAVRAGSLVLELHPWYASAALMEIPKIHKSLEKKSVTD